jgi:hypothetical protein
VTIKGKGVEVLIEEIGVGMVIETEEEIEAEIDGKLHIFCTNLEIIINSTRQR